MQIPNDLVEWSKNQLEKPEILQRELFNAQLQKEQQDKRILEASESLSKAVERAQEYLSKHQEKSCLEFDLESFRVFECQVIKSWFKTKIILMYHKQQSFSVEVIEKSWFNSRASMYENLSWLEALNLFRKELQ